MSTDTKIPKLSNQVQSYIKRIIHVQAGFIPGTQGSRVPHPQISLYDTLEQNDLKKCISVDEEKALDRIQHPFMLKNSTN